MTTSAKKVSFHSEIQNYRPENTEQECQPLLSS